MHDPAQIARLARNERRAMKRRVCAWCEAPLSADRCQAMYGRKCTKAEMQDRRDRALASYRPRAHLTTAAQEKKDG